MYLRVLGVLGVLRVFFLSKSIILICVFFCVYTVYNKLKPLPVLILNVNTIFYLRLLLRLQCLHFKGRVNTKKRASVYKFFTAFLTLI